MTPLQQTETKPMFTRGPSPGVRAFLLVVASILLMFLDHQRGHLQTLRQALSVAVYPIQVIVDLPSRGVSWAAESLTTRTRLVEENRQLRDDRLQFLARLQRLEALEAENARLRALLDSTPRLADRLLVAEILSVDLDPFRHRLVLDKGARDEVYVGQAMVDAGGIVGQVTRVRPFTSEAILISDPGHATPVEVNRNGLRTIALGTGDATRVNVPFLPNNADVRAGDLLVSSGLGGAFPAGYPVARVTRVERRPGEPFAVVEAEPTGALNREREVLLVWTPPDPAEQEAAGETPAPAEPADEPPASTGGETS